MGGPAKEDAAVEATKTKKAAPTTKKAPATNGGGDDAVVLFSNSRSGGGKGKKVLERLGACLGADRVFDLGENPHPERILARPEWVAASKAGGGLRIIVCGGDGTMTWIMAAIDVVRETEGLDASHRFFVAMMPLGTGNDLARTFGWGGAFRGACLKPSWVAAARAARPTALDRWLVCVMPSAEGQKPGAALLDVPEVFSAHEFSTDETGAAPKSKHSVLKAGRHHSRRMTEQSVAHLVQHDAEMRKPDKGGLSDSSRTTPATSVDSVDSSAPRRPLVLSEGDDRAPRAGRRRTRSRRASSRRRTRARR